MNMLAASVGFFLSLAATFLWFLVVAGVLATIDADNWIWFCFILYMPVLVLSLVLHWVIKGWNK